jgi:hypothetical protein
MFIKRHCATLNNVKREKKKGFFLTYLQLLLWGEFGSIHKLLAPTARKNNICHLWQKLEAGRPDMSVGSVLVRLLSDTAT